MMKLLVYIEEVIGNLVVLLIFGCNIFIFSELDMKLGFQILLCTIYICIIFICSAIIDAIQVLKRLGVSKFRLNLNMKLYKELWSLLKYGASLFEGRIGSIDGKTAYTRKRYTSQFYDKFQFNKELYNNGIMIREKVARAYSESFIMRNNLPKSVTEEQICEVWREPKTDKIYYGSLMIMNILFYSWYFMIR